MTKASNPPLDSSLELYVRAALGKKAFDLVILDVRQLTSITDAFIICSGRSNRQVTAIAENIQVSLKKNDIRPLSVEGKREGHWALLDYGHVVIHIFYEPIRDFYDLESLWIDAKKIQAENLVKQGKEI
ncbi:MAG: ribosome silencing factor [Desulfobacterales bacterium]|nr:MAG: ribosome silencing factor [Desulfobacterales bacterium]